MWKLANKAGAQSATVKIIHMMPSQALAERLKLLELEDSLQKQLGGRGLTAIQVAEIGVQHGLPTLNTVRLMICVCGIGLSEALEIVEQGN